MKEIKLTRTEAAKLAVISQYHFHRELEGFAAGPEGTYEIIRHLGYVQIDTISAVERAHHHTLWNRCRSYTPGDLDILQTTPRRIFEYWSHAAAYLTVQDYRFCLPRMQRIRKVEICWFPRNKRMIDYVLDRIKSEGPLQAKDFESPGKKPGPWWDWKPAKIALEYLFMEGTLLVVTRKGFQKVYDLAERVLPTHINTQMPSSTEMADYLIETGLRSLGLISRKDIVYQKKDRLEKIGAVLQGKLKENSIKTVNIEGINEPYYTTTGLLDLLDTRIPPFLRFLSPFDNFMIRRQRVLDLFDFQYQLECYVPAAKRKRGYFSLPVLYRDRLIGTMDAKADRKPGIFIIKNLHLDRIPGDEDDFPACFHQELRAFMAFNGCTELEVESTYPRGFKIHP
jgi:uncharacterized protein YcaQ